MSQLYQKPQPTGDEYVKTMQEFLSKTLDFYMKAPEKWGPVLTKPLVDSVREATNFVVKANGVYINESTQTTEEAIAAYKERRTMLYQALRTFRTVDANFEQVMDYINLAQSEKRRLKNILDELIKELRKENPDIQKITIRVISHYADMEYQSAGCVKVMKLKITAKIRDSWLRTENEAKRLIANRIKSDNRAISRLEKVLQTVH